MNDSGLRGAGLLFAMILLFLTVVTLISLGHASAAAVAGLGGALLLAAVSGWFLRRKWRAARRFQDFQDDGDVAFCSAVFLLCLLAAGAGVARALGIPARFLALLSISLSFAGPVVRHYLRPER